MRYTIKKNEQRIPIYDMHVDEYVVDLHRPFGGYESGDLICDITLFDIFLLNIAIRKDGSLIFRSWSVTNNGNPYLHTSATKDDFTPTEEQINTVAGLFSGRICFEGLQLAVGASVQAICPIDVAKEEARIGKTIYLA